MKRLHFLLICLAVFSLSVAGVWAAEEASWGEVKSATEIQPAAKPAVIPISFQWTNVDVGEFVVKDKGNHLILKGGTVRWDVVGDLTGTAELLDCFGSYNYTSGEAQENFRCRLTVSLDGVDGVFEGRAHDHYTLGPPDDDVAQMVLQGSEGFAGLTLKARIVEGLPGGPTWEGQILAR